MTARPQSELFASDVHCRVGSLYTYNVLWAESSSSLSFFFFSPSKLKTGEEEKGTKEPILRKLYQNFSILVPKVAKD